MGARLEVPSAQEARLRLPARSGSKVTMWDNEDIRRSTTAYICRKHQALYNRHFPGTAGGKGAMESKLLGMVRERDTMIRTLGDTLHERDDLIRLQTEWIRSLEQRMSEQSILIGERDDFVAKLGAEYRKLEAQFTEANRAREDAEQSLQAIRKRDGGNWPQRWTGFRRRCARTRLTAGFLRGSDPGKKPLPITSGEGGH